MRMMYMRVAYVWPACSPERMAVTGRTSVVTTVERAGRSLTGARHDLRYPDPGVYCCVNCVQASLMAAHGKRVSLILLREP